MSWHIGIVCDAPNCESTCDPHVTTAKAARKEAKQLGWSCAHPDGRDYCPQHASEFDQRDPQYWEKIRIREEAHHVPYHSHQTHPPPIGR